MRAAASSRHGRVADRLGRRIVSGTLRPCVARPGATDPAGALSTWRPAMRQAVKPLSGKGLVASLTRRGTVVRPRAAWNTLDPGVLDWRRGEGPNAAFVPDLFELHRFIEPEAAGCAATRATPATLSDVEGALQAMGTAETASPASVEADVALHRSTLIASGNAFLVGFAPAIEASLRLAFSVQRQACPIADHVVPDHRAVVGAIRRGDADGARSAVRTLLAQSEAIGPLKDGEGGR